MNNPGIDLEIWKQLRQKWTDLDSNGHTLKIDFQLIADPNEKKNILAIDVIQHIDDEPVTETVQRKSGEAYSALGIADLSMERLVEVYKEIMKQLHKKSAQRKADVVVTMVPTSPTSGALNALFVLPDTPVQTPVQVNYQHYYVLNALRDRMIELLGEHWKSVRVIYHEGGLDFYFEY